MNQQQEIQILMAEDSPGDARLTMEAFKEWKIKNKIHLVGDGEEALSFLYKRDQYTGAPRPDMILLDLNMPKKDGREVLATIKEDENLKRIPVIILTTSKEEEDVFMTYNLHANSFITKPIGFDHFVEIIKGLENYWFYLVKLPRN